MLFESQGSVELPTWRLGDQRMYRLSGTPLRRKVSQAHRRVKVGEDEMERWAGTDFVGPAGVFGTE
jgi:hypothetical protein